MKVLGGIACKLLLATTVLETKERTASQPSLRSYEHRETAASTFLWHQMHFVKEKKKKLLKLKLQNCFLPLRSEHIIKKFLKIKREKQKK